VDPAVQVWNRSLLDNLRYGSTPVENDALAQILEGANVQPLLDRLPEGLQTPLGEGGALVSGGEGQRVRLGRAMMRRSARLVIFDEPFRGLDRDRRRELLKRARAWWPSATVLCITHDISETLDFARVLVIERGQIVEDGDPAKLAVDSTSRYGQLLISERALLQSLWGGEGWRRVRMEAGRLTESSGLDAETQRKGHG
jgi:ATP-binding cassette subfamily B protein